MIELAQAERIADGILFEDELHSMPAWRKKRTRAHCQFGVLMPKDHVELVADADHSWAQTDCLVEGKDPRVTVRVRFLQIERQSMKGYPRWDEALERSFDLDFSLEPGVAVVPFDIAGTRDAQGNYTRQREHLEAELTVRVEPVEQLSRVQVRIENVTTCAWSGARRGEVFPFAMVGLHLLLRAEDGEFLSLLEPPEWAQGAVTVCRNVRTWPVLVGEEGERHMMLSSPIILHDYPQVLSRAVGDLSPITRR